VMKYQIFVICVRPAVKSSTCDEETAARVTNRRHSREHRAARPVAVEARLQERRHPIRTNDERRSAQRRRLRN
jgi:hypothetical protein